MGVFVQISRQDFTLLEQQAPHKMEEIQKKNEKMLQKNANLSDRLQSYALNKQTLSQNNRVNNRNLLGLMNQNQISNFHNQNLFRVDSNPQKVNPIIEVQLQEIEKQALDKKITLELPKYNQTHEQVNNRVDKLPPINKPKNELFLPELNYEKQSTVDNLVEEPKLQKIQSLEPSNLNSKDNYESPIENE